MKWAETYRGSGRLTGRLADEPTYTNTGEVAPDWVYVGDMTEDEFYADFEKQQHDHCHRPGWAAWYCSHCQAAGWVE